MKKGLTTEEAKQHLLQFGTNTIKTQEKFSILTIFISQFPNVVNLILTLASILSFVLGDVIDGIFILAILILNAIFGFFQEFRAEKAAQALKKFVISTVRVFRDGQEQTLAASLLVPEDVVVLDEGEKIPADGILIEGRHVEVDEAVLTGESLPVLKTLNEEENELLMGTTIMRGHGKMLVQKTGADTRFGEITKTLSEIKEDKTPLHIQIDRLGKQLAVGVVFIGIVLILIGLVQNRDFFSILLISVSLSVAAIPEGLPAVITIALALGMQRMAKKRAIVRKMAAIETLGATGVILIDKTGTLTQNEMRVKKVWHEGNEESRNLLLRACALGNTSSLILKNDGQSLDVVGDKTDGALLLFAKEQVGELDTFKNEGEVIDEYVFDPTTKTVTVVWKYKDSELVFVRGAPERILVNSKSALWQGEAVTLTEELRVKIEQEFSKLAREGLRIIAFAFKKKTNAKSLGRAQLEKDLTFLGFVGIYDPPRKEAAAAVRLAKEAGIHTVMVTGDNEMTALAIAKEVGLIEKDEDVILGSQLKILNDEQLLAVIGKTRIFARTTPMDKLRLVELFKKQKLIVGVTGDGVNDALALKRADVGVAMGVTGTDVAREASDVIITDDNFASLVAAVEEGRTIYDNIVKVITFLLAANLAEVATIFLAIMFGLPTPLLPTQILWMNLVTDGLPALALASDTKDPSILKRSPRDPRQNIVTVAILRTIVLGGAAMTAITLSVFFLVFQSAGANLARAVAFNLIIGIQMFFIFFVRGRKHPLSNRFIITAIIVIVIMQVVIMTQPALRSIFHIVLF